MLQPVEDLLVTPPLGDRRRYAAELFLLCAFGFLEAQANPHRHPVPARVQAGGQVVFDGGDDGGQSGLRRLLGRGLRVVGVPVQRLADGQPDRRVAIAGQYRPGRGGSMIGRNSRAQRSRSLAVTCRLNIRSRAADGLCERFDGAGRRREGLMTQLASKARSITRCRTGRTEIGLIPKE